MTQRRLRVIVIGAFVLSLPTVAFVWNDQGARAAVVLAVSLLAMLVGGLVVAHRL